MFSSTNYEVRKNEGSLYIVRDRNNKRTSLELVERDTLSLKVLWSVVGGTNKFFSFVCRTNL